MKSTSKTVTRNPEDPFARRIGRLVRELGGPRAAARIAGVSEDQIGRYTDAISAPKFEAIARLASEAGFSLDWVWTGEGEPELAKRRTEIAPGTSARQLTEAPGDEYVALPEYNVRAAAGVGEVVQSEHVVDWLYFRRDWLRRTLGVSPAQLVVISASGDSMRPTIEDGDIVVVDTSMPKLRGDGVYVLAIGDMLLVKRISVMLDGSLIIRADNPAYDNQEVISPDEGRDLRVVGRVVWVGGRI